MHVLLWYKAYIFGKSVIPESVFQDFHFTDHISW